MTAQLKAAAQLALSALECLFNGKREEERAVKCAYAINALRAALAAPADRPDDLAVEAFAQTMKAKLAAAREKGRGGWQECPPADLSRMLREHVEKGDPRDVAIFCMFLHHLGAGIAAEAVPTEPVNSRATPSFWPGDRVRYWSEHFSSTLATVKKAETRWSKCRKPCIFYHLIPDGEKASFISPAVQVEPVGGKAAAPQPRPALADERAALMGAPNAAD